MPESEETVLREWVRRQLEEGDSPEVLKAALKNRELNPAIVDRVLASLKRHPPAKKEEESEEMGDSSKEFYNYALKSEVDNILSSAKPVDSDYFYRAPESAQTIHAKESKKTSHKKEERLVKQKRVAGEKRQESNQITEEGSIGMPREESLFSLFVKRACRCVPRINLRFPRASAFLFNSKVVIVLGIMVAVLLVTLLVSFGLDWYADRLARSVLG